MTRRCRLNKISPAARLCAGANSGIEIGTMRKSIELSEVNEQDMLIGEVTDAMLETAGASPQNGGAFTVNLCTVMADCSS